MADISTQMSNTTEIEDKDLLSITKWLEKCKECSTFSEKVSWLERCTLYVNNFGDIVITNSLVLLMEQVLDFTIIPTFTKRDYFSYDKSDFENYPELSKSALQFLISVFNNCVYKTENSSTDESLQMLAKIMVKFVIVIGGYIKCPMWSSSDCQTLCYQLIEKLKTLFHCQTENELLLLEASYTSGTLKNQKETLVSAFFSACCKPLSSSNWQRNPFLSESFSWIISQVKSPHLSCYIDQTMAISLNFLDDHQECNKIKGISCLMDLISNTSNEELRWYNHADVIYNSLKHNMYNKEPAVVQHAYPCLFAILKVVDKTTNLSYHHEILEVLIKETSFENLLVLRRLYMKFLCQLIQQIGFSCIRHLNKLVKLVEQFLEVEDGEEEKGRIFALELLEQLILFAWPRITNHSQVIVEAALKLLVDINGPYYQNGTETGAQRQLNDSAIRCLNLLVKVCPEVGQCLQDPDLVKGLQHVAQILKSVQY